MKYILFNSLNKYQGKEEKIQEFKNKFKEETQTLDVISLDYKSFIDNLKEDDEVVVLGGDGTLNHMINIIDCDIKTPIYLVPTGTGNDFFRDVVSDPNVDMILLNPYLTNLPTVEVKGKKQKFINGIGFGIDGYCCEVGDKLRAKSDKPVNYTSIAIKGLLFHFKPVTAKIKIDGQEYEFKHVWLAPTMKGRFYGGGMMIAPNQNRLKDDTLSVVLYISKSKLKALMTFPSIFKGEHIKKEKMVKIFKGKTIEVTFDRPTALQIDGETVTDVLSYKASL